MNASFNDKLAVAWRTSSSCLCVGLDPSFDRIPSQFARTEDGVLNFCKEIVQAVAAHVCAFKPNHAHFAALGYENALRRLIAYIHGNWSHIPVILDAKRGDIGSTASKYAAEAFRRYEADAVTVNPYLGWDSVAPFIEYENKGVAVLCRTSNPDSDWIQSFPDQDPLYLRIARRIHEEANPNLLLVVGATDLASMARVRAAAPATTFLVPGVGAQGGSAREVMSVARTASGCGVIVNSSRSVLYAGKGENFASEAAREAERLGELLTLHG